MNPPSVDNAPHPSEAGEGPDATHTPASQLPSGAAEQLHWPDVARDFSIISARDLLALQSMERHQDVCSRIPWLTSAQPPLALLFVSHRWETLSHPDPTGRQLRAVQEFLRRVCVCLEGMLVPREERLRLVPSLAAEGTLQAEELARRILGFGPFASGPPCLAGSEARTLIRDQFNFFGDDRAGFRNWLAGSIGVWVDYTCMPQQPLSPEEYGDFRRTLRALDSLVMSSTIIALRNAGDDYAARAWCVAEFHLASAPSWARGLFIDIGRMERTEDVAFAPTPAASRSGPPDVLATLAEGYEQDLSAFRRACDDWHAFDGPAVDVTPRAPWGEYRSLQGSSLYPAALDPNPGRRAVEAIRAVERLLVERWLMTDTPQRLDLGTAIGNCVAAQGLRCSDQADLPYLGLLLSSHGWVDAFRPVFRACLERYLISLARPRNAADAMPPLAVTLTPPPEYVRSLFSQVTPHSADTWCFRLSAGPSGDPHERAVVERVRAALKARPLKFTLQGPDEASVLAET